MGLAVHVPEHRLHCVEVGVGPQDAGIVVERRPLAIGAPVGESEDASGARPEDEVVLELTF